MRLCLPAYHRPRSPRHFGSAFHQDLLLFCSVRALPWWSEFVAASVLSTCFQPRQSFIFLAVRPTEIPKRAGAEQAGRVSSSLTIIMSDPNRPPPFQYSSYLGPLDLVEHDVSLSDGAGSHYSQPFVGPQVSFETVAGFAENPAGTSRVNNASEWSMNSKVPIPRSAQPSSWTSSGRVSRACENCREQKAKCSGHRPTCQRCQEAGIRCSYGDRKREKVAKQLSDLTSQVQMYESLLREISPKLDPQSAQYVEQVVNEKLDIDQAANRKPSISLATLRNEPVEPAVASGSDVDSSLVALDYTNEDFNRDEKIQAMGFVGQHSEIAWFYRLKRMLGRSILKGASDRLSVSSVNFFLDDSDIPVRADVDLGQRPPQAVADQLVDNYFQAVHPSFPVIGKVIFLRQYKSFSSTPFVRPGKRWLAILNLVYAIATRYLRQMEVESTIAPDDDIVYFSRAWKLSMSDDALLDHPNLQQVQVEALTSFYLASVAQVNRSWRICGICVRSAVAMGLNLRNESSTVVHTSKETRYRVWWSIYLLDVSLSVMTGRPPNVASAFCTTPLPVPFREEDFLDENVAQLISDHEARSMFMESLSLKGPATPTTEISTPPETGSVLNMGKPCEQVASSAVKSLIPNISLYFLHSVALGLIMRESIDKLYAPGAAQKLWHEIEAQISELNGKADAWLARLPAAFHFTQGTRSFERQRVSLAFLFYSAKILITQPCLSRLARYGSNDDTQGSFCDIMAAMCVDLAAQVLDLLPDSPDPTWAYHVSPWWSILHYLMQSAAVLLTELLFLAKRGSVKQKMLLERLCRTGYWLTELSRRDTSFHRALEVCRGIVAQKTEESDAEIRAIFES
ncbi:fungal-specific transcription factor domain-containing protein [Aspergillus ambiguus]|uniref:putative C6 transcription factor n=1 Tax=Aspergillus ambiguus TaxID=176160 RepID=UPI003CCCA8CA